MLSDVLLGFLEKHPGETFTAREMWERVSWEGRILPAHIQLALERRLFPGGFVAADGNVSVAGDFPKAMPGTRWCVLDGASVGFLVYDPFDGICEYIPGETWR